jgi:hypothetical protein
MEFDGRWSRGPGYIRGPINDRVAQEQARFPWVLTLGDPGQLRVAPIASLFWRPPRKCASGAMSVLRSVWMQGRRKNGAFQSSLSSSRRSNVRLAQGVLQGLADVTLPEKHPITPRNKERKYD